MPIIPLAIVLLVALAAAAKGPVVALAVAICLPLGMIVFLLAVVVLDDYFQKQEWKRVTAEALSGD